MKAKTGGRVLITAEFSDGRMPKTSVVYSDEVPEIMREAVWRMMEPDGLVSVSITKANAALKNLIKEKQS